MTSKERIQAVLNHQMPDRVPMNEFIYSRKLYRDVIGKWPAFYNGEDVMDCAHKLGLDMGVIPIGGFSGISDREICQEEFIDEWGITYKRKENVAWPADAPAGFPLKTKKDWKNYTIPDINQAGRLAQIEIALRKGKEHNMAVFGSIRGPFTQTWLLFGYEYFSFMLFEEPKLINEIVEKVTDFSIAGGKMLAAAGVDAVLFADDYGGKAGPLMSPQHFARFIWPHQGRLVKEIRSTGVPVFMHSDGNITALLPDIVKKGIAGYHPIERNANMSISQVKKDYGNKLILMGNVSNQGVLIYGTVDEVIEQTKECISIAAPGGNYILSSDHSVHDDMPLENIYAMIETGKKFGKYPIKV